MRSVCVCVCEECGGGGEECACVRSVVVVVRSVCVCEECGGGDEECVVRSVCV